MYKIFVVKTALAFLTGSSSMKWMQTVFCVRWEVDVEIRL